MAVGCGLAVVFLLRVLAAFVSDYWRTARASRFRKSEARVSSGRQMATIKKAIHSKDSSDASGKTPMGMTLGTVLTMPVYASWETIRAASSFDVRRDLKAKHR